jgi:hypothetical protein
MPCRLKTAADGGAVRNSTRALAALGAGAAACSPADPALIIFGGKLHFRRSIGLLMRHGS